MCELMTNLTYAAMAAGTAAKYAAAQKSSKAMTAVQQLEAERQARLDKEAEGLLAKGVENNTRMSVDTQLEDNKNKRLDAMNAAVANIPVGDAVSRLGESGQNRLVQSEAASKASEGKAVNKSVGDAIAAIGSLSDTNLNTGINNARGLQQTGMIGGFKRGSSGVAGIENESASHAGDNLSQIGDILNTLAVVSGGYAAQGTTPWMSAADKAAAVAANTGVTAGKIAGAASIAAPAITPLFGQQKFGPYKGAYGFSTPQPGPWASGYVTPGTTVRPKK